jgi:hypothetical protein
VCRENSSRCIGRRFKDLILHFHWVYVSPRCSCEPRILKSGISVEMLFPNVTIIVSNGQCEGPYLATGFWMEI